MSNQGNSDGNTDGLETTPSCVGEVSTKQRDDVYPKRDRRCPDTFSSFQSQLLVSSRIRVDAPYRFSYAKNNLCQSNNICHVN